MSYFLRNALLLGMVMSVQYCYAQTARCDTAQAELLVKQAMEYNIDLECDSSITCLRIAAKIFLKSECWQRYVHCLNIEADRLFRKVALDSVEVVLHQALDVEKEKLKPDDLECALTYSLTGLLYIYRENFDDAIKYIIKGKTIREQL